MAIPTARMAEDGRAELDRLLFEADNLILIESQAPESDAGASQQFSATRREELDFLLRQADTVARAVEDTFSAPKDELRSQQSSQLRTELDSLLRQADTVACSSSSTLAASGEPVPSQPTIHDDHQLSGRASRDDANVVPIVERGSSPAASVEPPSLTSETQGTTPAPSALQIATGGPQETPCDDAYASPPRLLPAPSAPIRAGDVRLLHLEPMDGVAEELGEQHAERGRPCAVALNSSCIAVGTSRGHILLYERAGHTLSTVLEPSAPRPSSSVIKTSLSSSLPSSLASSFFGSLASSDSTAAASGGGGVRGPVGDATDAVTAVQVSESGALLLAGHASGRLVLWDVSSGSILKEGLELHVCSPSSPTALDHAPDGLQPQPLTVLQPSKPLAQRVSQRPACSPLVRADRGDCPPALSPSQ